MTMLDLGFWGIYAVSIGVSAWSARRLKGFLARNPTIADDACLAQYKALVRAEMYLSLLMIGLLIGGFVAGIALMVQRGLAGLAFVVLANALVFGAGLAHRRLEKRVKGLPAASPDLETEYRRVSDSWVKKALPDF